MPICFNLSFLNFHSQFQSYETKFDDELGKTSWHDLKHHPLLWWSPKPRVHSHKNIHKNYNLQPLLCHICFFFFITILRNSRTTIFVFPMLDSLLWHTMRYQDITSFRWCHYLPVVLYLDKNHKKSNPTRRTGNWPPSKAITYLIFPNHIVIFYLVPNKQSLSWKGCDLSTDYVPN